jgi:hypothetical protein
VANANSDNIAAYAIDYATGALTQMLGSPFAAGTSPRYIVSAYTTDLLEKHLTAEAVVYSVVIF